jgi:predicted CoA-binding protein
MDCVTGVLEAESIYSETKEWKDQKSVRPNETRLSATHGIKSGASRLNSTATARVNQYMSVNTTEKEHLSLLSAHKWAIVGDCTNISSHAFRISRTLRGKQKMVRKVDPSLEEDVHGCSCSLVSLEEDVDAICLCINPTPFGSMILEQILQLGVKLVYIQETHFWTLRKGSALLAKMQANGLQIHRGNMLLEFR